MNAYNTKTASVVTGASERQLRYWDRMGIVKPSVGEARGRGSHRLYSFLDLVQASAAKQLRDDGLSLQKLGRALRILKEHPDQVKHPLAQLRLITDGKSLFRLTEESNIFQDILAGRQSVHVWAVAIKPLCDAVQSKLARTIKIYSDTLHIQGNAYRVHIEPDVVDGGFIAECPALPGCVTDGETKEEAMRNIRDAIADWLSAGKEKRLAKAE